jgi:hypothetical protein
MRNVRVRSKYTIKGKVYLVEWRPLGKNMSRVKFPERLLQFDPELLKDPELCEEALRHELLHLILMYEPFLHVEDRPHVLQKISHRRAVRLSMRLDRLLRTGSDEL